MLKISVVTVCYNAAVSIEQTMLSVLGQSYPDIEYIVIDGGSTDGTVDIIKKYTDRLAYWVSEPDKGIYDAMNKGIAAATCSYINFMNSGDSFYDNRVVEAVVPYLSSDMKAVIYGNAAICNGEKYIIKKLTIFRRTGFRKTKFLWLGSSGSILKGVDLVIEAFLRHPELEIDIVGPVENEVKAVYAKQLHNASNIRFHGYVDVNSHRFMNIVSDTAFLIYPSVTEGFPGAVIAGMKLGLVPLVSKIAAPECIESCGYQLNDISLHSIEQALQWSQSLSENQIKEQSDAVVQYSTLFSIERFGQEFNRFLDDICRTAASN